MSPDFQKYAQAKTAGKTDVTTSELFTEYLKKNQKIFHRLLKIIFGICNGSVRYSSGFT
jgi:hypothetical protein